ncbi:MAG: acyl-CoA/acyl-ACP dehydrogenase [Streptomyces sp.]|jgi:isobutylamine N-monooxygenase|uniref:acyl-CoA dehydrogenase family protein n=1 Tax=Streptomyces sp. TaxID=1931 RepID=UPI0025F6EB58|nr:acyl-CoA dehydrogenase family protein [Streptomyces sp.]MBW8792508.1 acyl-CoA/acyl-ACP dehydrogenase [Streptomyces sp.]
MRSLDLARAACERHHPGLLKALAEEPLTTREAAGSPVIDIFRAHGGPALLVPTRYGGLGVHALEAVQVTRAIGALSPSLAAGATMHNFTVAMLFQLAERLGAATAEQTEVLYRIAPERMLLASGWAEGRTEQNILAPTVVATPTEGGFLVNGAKKPCSLSGSMDLLTASAFLPDENGNPQLVILLVPAKAPGVSLHPFWGTGVLAAAQSDEVRLEDVFVPEHQVIRSTPEDPGRLDDLQTAAFVWFELLVTSAYVGVAATLTERVLERRRGSVSDRAALAVQLESAVALTEGMARAVDDGAAGDDAVAAVLVTRFAVQKALAAVSDLAVELLGGIAFIESPDIAYLSSAVRPLAFHPPSRTSTTEALVEYFAGGPLLLS